MWSIPGGVLINVYLSTKAPLVPSQALQFEEATAASAKLSRLHACPHLLAPSHPGGCSV